MRSSGMAWAVRAMMGMTLPAERIPSRQFIAVHDGHLDVGDDQVIRPVGARGDLDHVKGVLAVACDIDRGARAAEKVGDEALVVDAVFSEEDPASELVFGAVLWPLIRSDDCIESIDPLGV